MDETTTFTPDIMRYGAPFTREELQAIWGRAAALALGLNPVMNAAYERLAWACCVLDAFLARAAGKVA